MNSEILKHRTKAYSISIGKLSYTLPPNILNRTYSNHLVRCSSSAGANYRVACRTKSNVDFLNKLQILEEELNETRFFLGLLDEFNGTISKTIEEIWREGNELLSIIVAAIITIRKNDQSRKVQS